MRLPFTHDQFLDVFAAYHRALWPAVVGLWIAALIAVLLAGRSSPTSRRITNAVVALLWVWCGIAYAAAFFSAINPAARLFAVLFVAQAGLVLWMGVVQDHLRVEWGRAPHQLAGLALVGYGLLYPLLNLALGMSYPRIPTFGVPCPTTILTIGLLLAATPESSGVLKWIPIAWCVIGGSAAFLLGMTADLMLPVAGLLLAMRTIGLRGR